MLPGGKCLYHIDFLEHTHCRQMPKMEQLPVNKIIYISLQNPQISFENKKHNVKRVVLPNFLLIKHSNCPC